MARTRRTRFFLLRLTDRPELDIAALLRGEVRLETTTGLHGISILNGKELQLSLLELDLLLSLPSDRYVEVDDDRIDRLASEGFVLLEDGKDELADLRRRDEQLSKTQWNLYGALYHAMTRWRNMHGDPGSADAGEHVLSETVEQFVAQYGMPPSHFHALEEPLDVRELPLVRSQSGFTALLRKRRTSRMFDPSRPVTEDELAVLLYETYGAHGYAPMAENVAGLQKTSPSGGGLHPIEAYPLVLDVEGVEAGLYHYGVERHSLELIEPLARTQAEELAVQFMSGQSYFHGASALVILTARFYRSFWKYRDQEKALGVLLMDAGHLSQTFYLVCAELGLGAFVTAAINSANVDERLGLDGFSEGALAISGCGRLAAQRSRLDPSFEPYVPRETRIE